MQVSVKFFKKYQTSKLTVKFIPRDVLSAKSGIATSTIMFLFVCLSVRPSQSVCVGIRHSMFCLCFPFVSLVIGLVSAIALWQCCKIKTCIINSLFKRAFKYGYVKSIITVEEILGSYDEHLFHTASCENHCLHHLLPVAKSTKYTLRAVGLSLEHVLSELHKKTFINRMVFADCYWLCSTYSACYVFVLLFVFTVYSLLSRVWRDFSFHNNNNNNNKTVTTLTPEKGMFLRRSCVFQFVIIWLRNSWLKGPV